MSQFNTDSMDICPLSLEMCKHCQINSTKAMWHLLHFSFSPTAVSGDSKGGQTAVLCTSQICDGGQDWPGKAAGGKIGCGCVDLALQWSSCKSLPFICREIGSLISRERQHCTTGKYQLVLKTTNWMCSHIGPTMENPYPRGLKHRTGPISLPSDMLLSLFRWSLGYCTSLSLE